MLGDAGLSGKTALVSGGSRGIGRAIVEALAHEGMTVSFIYRENAAAAAEVIDNAERAGLKVSAEQLDVREVAGCEALVKRLVERHGGIDLLVNNSAVIRDNLLGAMQPGELREVLETNVEGVFNLTRAVVTPMISRRSGKIVNLSSVAATQPGRGQSNYAASKGAVEAFTRALAVELAPRRITVNAVAPGVIETEMTELLRAHEAELKARILMRRFGQPSEVAALVVFLASRFADYITGQSFRVDGGFKME